MTSYNVQNFSYIWDYIIGLLVAQEYKRIHALFQGFMNKNLIFPAGLISFWSKSKKIGL